MLKYVLGFVAGVVGLFLGVTIAVLISHKAGTLSSALGCGFAIAFATGVYKFFKRREDKAEFEKEKIPVISSDDKLKFQKAFELIDCEATEISEIIVMVGNEGMYSYKIGMRTPQFWDIEANLIREELHKFFPGYTKFDFVDLNDEKMAWRFSRGTLIYRAGVKQSTVI